MYVRAKEHVEALEKWRRGKNKDGSKIVKREWERIEKNFMVKHSIEKHESRKDVEFYFRVRRHYGRNNLKRQVAEAVNINRREGNKMNSKAEYRQPRVPRVVVHSNMNE